MSNEPPKILLVDDKPENLLTLTQVLKSFDAQLITASSGNEALELVLKHEFALILLDVYMPVMSGFETAEYMRTQIDTPIIFITAFGKEEQHVFKGYESGAVDYLFKPFDPHVLKSKVHVFLDLFQQKKMLVQQAQALRQSLDNQQKITEELQNTTEELTTSKQRLEELVHQMNQFVGIVSHDLRGPLSTLCSLTESLLETSEVKEPRILEALHTTSNRAMDLVYDLLDLTALETGQVQLEMIPCDFPMIAQQALKESQIFAERKKIHLNNEVQPVPKVQIDPFRILQVLNNLLTNAIKFTPRSGKITLQAITEDNGLRVKILDNGVGIPPDNLPKLFEKHEKISTQGTEGERGTGFGLPLSQELIQAHGSQIEVFSEVGKGSCFSFVLPWAKSS